MKRTIQDAVSLKRDKIHSLDEEQEQEQEQKEKEEEKRKKKNRNNRGQVNLSRTDHLCCLRTTLCLASWLTGCCSCLQVALTKGELVFCSQLALSFSQRVSVVALALSETIATATAAIFFLPSCCGVLLKWLESNRI